MGMYDDLLAIKGSGTVFDRLTPISLAKADEIKTLSKALPNDYVSFLLDIGFGEIGEVGYMLYDGLIDPLEIYGGEGLGGILLFGDDFQGFNTGFKVENWSVVEIDSVNLTVCNVAADFQNFIRGKIMELG